jgi:hypothetical protein
VATSMLTKHAAPTRLQRWGIELGTYLPHLRISYRRGADNGLADLLSRFPAFRRFTTTREDIVELPDDLFDYVGQAPLFTRSPGTSADDKKKYLEGAKYELYDLADPRVVPDNFWCMGDAPEIPGRGMSDRMSAEDKEALNRRTTGRDELVALVEATHRDFGRLDDVLAAVLQSLPSCQEDTPLDYRCWERYVPQFVHLLGRKPRVRVHGEVRPGLDDTLSEWGFERSDSDDVELQLTVGPSPAPTMSDGQQHVRLLAQDPAPEASHRLLLCGSVFHACVDFCPEIPPTDTSRGYFAPSTRARLLFSQALARVLHARHGVQLGRGSDLSAAARELWLDAGLFSVARVPDPASPSGGNQEPEVPATREAAKRYTWAQDSQVDGLAAAAARALDEAADRDPDPGLLTPIDITGQLQREDPELRLIIEKMSESRHAAIADNYELQGYRLYRRVVHAGDVKLAICVPRHRRAVVLAWAHYSLIDGASHSGGDDMYRQLYPNYYWRGMKEE